MESGNTPSRRYFVKLPKYQQGEIWDGDKFERNKDKLFKDHADAEVTELSDYNGQPAGDNDSFTVHLPGYNGAELWDGAKLNRNYDKLLKDHPDVEIQRVNFYDYYGDQLKALDSQLSTLRAEKDELESYRYEPNAIIKSAADAETLTALEKEDTFSPEGQARSRRIKDIQSEMGKIWDVKISNPAYQREHKAKMQLFEEESRRMDALASELEASNPDARKMQQDLGNLDKGFVRSALDEGATAGLQGSAYVLDRKDNPEYYRDRDALFAAKLLYQDAYRTESAPSRYDETKTGIGNFFRGAAAIAPETLSPIALAKTFGEGAPIIKAVKTIQEAEGKGVNIVDLICNRPEEMTYLSPAQKELVKAFVIKSATDWARSEDLSLGYQSGMTAMQSVGFMADFLSAGGAGNKVANAATKGLTKAIAKKSTAMGLAGAERYITQAPAKFVDGTVKSIVKTTVMTPMMLSSYSNFLNNLATLDAETGGVDLSGKAITRAIGDVFIENFSESAGTQVEGILGFLPGMAGKGVSKTKFGDWIAGTEFGKLGKAFGNSQASKLLRQAGWNGYIGEIGEEWYGNALRVMTGVDRDALKDFTTIDQQIITLTSFAPMSIIGGGVSAAQYGLAKKGLAEKGKALSAALARSGYEQDQIGAILDITKATNPTQLAENLAPVVNQVAADNLPTSTEVYKAVMDYADAVARYRVFDGAYQGNAERQRQAKLDELNRQAGQSIVREREVEHGSTTKLESIRTVTLAGAGTAYVMGEDEENLALMDKDGKKSFMSKAALQDLIEKSLATDSGEMRLDDYLDAEIAARKQQDEAGRIRTETDALLADVRSRIESERKLNVGTTENPIMASVITIDNDGIVVENPDAEGGIEPYTWEQVAEKLGTPIDVKTDEQIEQDEMASLARQRDIHDTLKSAITDLSGTELSIKPSEDGITPAKKVYYIGLTALDDSGRLMIGVKDEDWDESFVSIDYVDTDALDNLLSQAAARPEAEASAQEQQAEEPAPQEKPSAEEIALTDNEGRKLPMKVLNGEEVVDESALWNKDARMWAEWNDEKRQDGGANSMQYIGTVIKGLEASIRKTAKAYGKETNFDKRAQLESAIAKDTRRLADLNGILAEYTQRKEAAEAAEQAAVAEKARKKLAEARKGNAEQLAQHNTESLQEIKRKWDEAPKEAGFENEIVLTDGTTVKGRYVLTEAFAPTPSHDARSGYQMTKGFPVDVNGRTVNDRDYEHDKAAQRLVEQKAQSYDQRAIQTPVVVSSDGIVLSGNDRTMASQLAAENGTDAKYTDYLKAHARMYGFAAEQMEGYANPRVVFVPDEAMPYTTETFARFNGREQKSQSRTEKAVKAGKTIDANTIDLIARIIDGFDSIAEAYADETAVARIVSTLVSAGVVQENEVEEMMDGKQLSGTGKDRVESIMLGAVLREDALRCAMQDGAVRRSIMSALMQLLGNNTLGVDYSLIGEFNDAIVLLHEAKASKLVKIGESMANFMTQPVLEGFGDNPLYSVTVQLIANVINGTKLNGLKNLLSLYNARAAEAASGQMDMFLGKVESKESIVRSILEKYGYNTETYTAAESEPGGEESGNPDEQAPSPVRSNAGNGEEGSGEEGEVGKPAETAREPESNQPEPALAEHIADWKDRISRLEEAKRLPGAATAAIDGLLNAARERLAELEISLAEQEVDTNPSDAQKEAGNYKKGHLSLDGHNITIENPKGSVRRGVGADGNAWETTLHNDYGYIRGTESVDGDHIDIFLSDNPTEGDVFVVDQVNPKTGEFDEHKVMYGFPDAAAAKEAYLSNYSDGWQGLGALTRVDKKEFKKWVDSSHRKTKPFSEYVSVGLIDEVNRETERKAVNEYEEQIKGIEVLDAKFPKNVPAEEIVERQKHNKPLFADEIFSDTLSSAPEELKGRISIRESSTGDEIEENFVQTYDIDGKPSGISRIEFFDARSDENPTRFIIDGSDVNAARAEQDKWENLALEYHKLHPEVILAISDESGIGFFTFKDAYNFLEWTKEQSAKKESPVKSAFVQHIGQFSSPELEEIAKRYIEKQKGSSKKEDYEEFAKAVRSWQDIITLIERSRKWLEYTVEDVLKYHPELSYDADSRQERQQKLAQILSSFDAKGANKFAYYAYEYRFKKDRAVLNDIKQAVENRKAEIERSGEATGRNLHLVPHRGSLDKVRDIFNQLNTDADLTELFNRVYAVASTLDLKVFWRANIGSKRNIKIAGGAIGDSVAYNLSILNDIGVDDYVKAQALLHELIHSVTNYAIQIYENANYYADKGIALSASVSDGVAVLQRIYDSLKSDPDFRGKYGANDTEEMVAELANPDFRVLLHKKKLWDNILDAICRILGIERKEDALSNLSAALDTLLENLDRDAYDEYTSRVKKSTVYAAFTRAKYSITASEDALQSIIDAAKADGTYMKAPNGKPSNLNERQWAMVRTPQFKQWFGDWEKAARIEKLRGSEPVEITGEEIEITDDFRQNKKNALAYGKGLQGAYTNADTGNTIQLQRGRKNGGLNEVLQHNYKDVEHIQSIAAIPQIIEKSVYVDSEENRDVAKNPNVSEYQHYVCGLRIGGEDYTVLSAIAVDKDGNRYYDHNLTHIEKGKLLDQINDQAVNGESFGTTPGTNPTTLNGNKGKKLVSILQTNSSKVVDGNGEPMVVYHYTDAKFTVFDRKNIGANTFGNAADINYATTATVGTWFTSNNQQPSNMGLPMELFLDIRNPKKYSSLEHLAEYLGDFISEEAREAYDEDWSDVQGIIDGGLAFQDEAKDDGYDGLALEDEEFGGISYVAFSPNQIKSATDNIGTFDANNPDIRYSIDEMDADYFEAIDNGDLESARQLAYDTILQLLSDAGISVEEISNEAMRRLAENSELKEKMLDTALPEDESSFKGTVVSSTSGAKVLNNLDNAISEYENKDYSSKNFLGDAAVALGATKHGSNSQYATFEAKNGEVVTIRLSNHNAKVSNFDNHEENRGVSIVISRKANAGMTNVTEYFYSDKQLRKSEGKPLADILKSIKQTLYSGEYKDTTGLAQVEEVNAGAIPDFMTVYHGSGAYFDHFDHSHMGEGEGNQAYGWGTYVTEVEGIGRIYAKASTTRATNSIFNQCVALIQDKMYSGEPFEDARNTIVGRLERILGANGEDSRNDANRKAIARLKALSESNMPKRFLYTVEIPDDNGSNYLDYKAQLSDNLVEPIAGALVREGWIREDNGHLLRLEKDGKTIILNERATGADLYAELEEGFGSDKAASELLSDAGYVGIKYPAQNQSGGREDGAKNYVIFKDADLKVQDHIEFLRDGDVVYGAAVGGKIYLNADRLNLNTPIHEYAHIWDRACRAKNPELWKRGVELMKQTSVWNEVANDPNYSHSDEDGIASEVHSRLTGEHGAELLEMLGREAIEGNGGILDKAARASVISKLRKWISEFWYWVKDSFAPWSSTEARRVSIEDFVNMPLSDLAKGTRVAEILAQANAGQKRANGEYADVSGMDMGIPQFSISRNNRKTIEGWLDKWERAQDGNAQERKRAVLDYLDTLDDATMQLAWAKWFCAGRVLMGEEDRPKVEQALTIAKRHRLDPLSFDSPMAIVNQFPNEQLKEKPVNPDTVPTLHKARELPKGLVIYDVDDTQESRENMRKIINTHFGKDCSPWCLLQGDGGGNLTERSAYYWRHYDAYPKQVAFRNGKLLAFSANNRDERLWWDRMDAAHSGIPITEKIPNDELVRTGTIEINPETGESADKYYNIHRGNKQNGAYEEWDNEEGEEMYSIGHYKNGELDGVWARYSRRPHEEWAITNKRFIKDGTLVMGEGYRGGECVLHYATTQEKYQTQEKYYTDYKKQYLRDNEYSEEATIFGGGSYKMEAAKIQKGRFKYRTAYFDFEYKEMPDNPYLHQYLRLSIWFGGGRIEVWWDEGGRSYADGSYREEKGEVPTELLQKVYDAYNIPGEPTMDNLIEYLKNKAGEVIQKGRDFDAEYAKKIGWTETKLALRFRSTESEAGNYSETNNGNRYRTSEQLTAEYGSRWLEEQTNGDGRHTTQVANTLSSYRKFGEWIKTDSAGREVSVLDASSGLGLGTQWMRENGISADDVEPYPSESRPAPTYQSYDDIDKRYDYIISNAVMNVIPDDWRADVLHSMADKLKNGGKLIINVRSAQSIENQGTEGKTKTTLDSPSEILVNRPDGSIRAYQKGFTKQELKEWCESELGEDYTVEIANKNNAGSSYDTAVLVTKQREGKHAREREKRLNDPTDRSESLAGWRDVAEQTARVLGIPVKFVKRHDMPEGHRNSLGVWQDGKIRICLENHRDSEDVKRTVLHEVVGHNGLRRLVGDENMDSFCMEVFRNASEEIRGKIAALAAKHGYDFAEATEEYLAMQTEEMDFTSRWSEFWTNVRHALMTLLRKIGLMDMTLNTKDVQWLMWQSYNANKRSDLLNQARRAYVSHRLGFSEADIESRIRVQSAIRDRVVERVALRSAAAAYNNAANYWLNRESETWADMYQSVNDLVEAIEINSGKAARGFEDVRLALNQQSSKGLAAIQSWTREHFNPMMEAVKGLMHEHAISLKEVERYVMLKHGLERNEVFAKRDAREFYKAAFDRQVQRINAREDWNDAVKKAAIGRAEAELEKHYDAIERGTDTKYKEFRTKDYGGLTALFTSQDAVDRKGYNSEEEYLQAVKNARRRLFDNVAEMEYAAMQEVAMYEDMFGRAAVGDLWSKINGATKSILKHQRDANMLTQESYEHVMGMFQYYVPLRGFADTEAEDLYTYYTQETRGTGYTSPLLSAHGRTSEAESPFGYIGAMANSAIVSDVKNETKLALYFFIRNRRESAGDIMTVSETWYEAVSEGEFRPAYFPYTEGLDNEEARQAYDEWEEMMQEKARHGLAFKGSDRFKLGYVVHIAPSSATEHAINLRVRGKELTLYLNGNPRAARAINGELNVERSADYQMVFGRLLRYFSSVNTSWNPEFWISNMQRDVLFSLMAVSSKEDREYNKEYHKNLLRMLATIVPGTKGVHSWKKALEDGTLGDSRYERHYRDFVENGGVTGYVVTFDNDRWEEEARKYTGDKAKFLTALGKVGSAVAGFGESIEQMTRFAAFVTSREMGRDLKESVRDAKELTVNFNRKGSGKAITFEDAKKLTREDGSKLSWPEQMGAVMLSWIPVYGRRAVMFFNASIQGLNAVYQLFKVKPGKTMLWAAGYFAMGLINAILHSMMDDDDEYLDIPDYERRNNALLGGNGVYFKWALPQEARVFYAFGDIVYNHIAGRTPNKGAVGETLEALMESTAPLNPAGGLSAVGPSALVPFVEAGLPFGWIWEGTNRDYKGSRIWNDMKYLSDEQKKHTPNYQKAYDGTGKLYIEFAKLMNGISGGDYADAGAVNLNPARMEHYLEGFGGGILTTINKTMKSTVGQLWGEDLQVRTTPFLSRLLTIPDERYRNAHTTELFNWYKSEAERFKTRFDSYRKVGDVKKVEKLLDSEDYLIYSTYQNYKGVMKYYNDQLKITEDNDERKSLMREQDEYRKQMIKDISEK